MKIRMLAIAAFALSTTIIQADEQLPVLEANGQVYSNVTVIKVTATDIYFSSPQGIGNAKLQNLKPELQKQFHYTPTNAARVQQKPAAAATPPASTPVAQAQMPAVQIEPTAPNKALRGLGIGMLAALSFILLVLYIFFCYCLKCICEKCDTKPGLLIWVPAFNTIRLLQAGGLSGWLFLLFLIPLVNLVMSIVMWVKVCQARGKSGWLVVLLFVPLANLFVIPYLAFSE
jgi:hypothetical protein